MNKQEFCNALSAAFGGLQVNQSDAFWNFSVWVEEKPKWYFVLQADYINKIESREDSNNDMGLLRKLPHGEYLLCIDPQLPLDGSMGDDVRIVSVQK